MYQSHIICGLYLRWSILVKLCLIFTGVLSGGCGYWQAKDTKRVLKPEPEQRFIASSDEFIIVMAQASDTLRSLAKEFLGDEQQDWILSDFNQIRELRARQEVIIPRKHYNPPGVYPHGYQTVPILTYHRFSNKTGKMTLAPAMFEQQMAYLKSHGYRVIRLSRLVSFLKGEAALPQNAVILTIDDGYRSAYSIAYPILKTYQFPATYFIYSDFTELKSGLRWPQMREMIDSTLIDIQPHSKTHSNLALQLAGEAPSAYRQRIALEIRHPAQTIARHLNIPVHAFSYPYGDTNDAVIAQLNKHQYRLGATVQRGGNAYFADPFMLHRTLIYGDQSMQAFQKSLDTFRVNKAFAGKTVLPKHNLAIELPPCPACPYVWSMLVQGHRVKAAQFTQQGDLAAALVQWQILRTLDAGNLDVQAQIVALQDLIEQRVEEHLRNGKRAFQRQRYKRAKRAFLAALALAPLQSAPHGYLQQIEKHDVRKKQRQLLVKTTHAH